MVAGFDIDGLVDTNLALVGSRFAADDRIRRWNFDQCGDPRYARRVASIVCGHDTLDIWMVIQTDEVLPDEILAAGFEPVPEEMSDDEVRERYGVEEIYRVTDNRRKAVN